jgi:N-acetyltransferase 10
VISNEEAKAPIASGKLASSSLLDDDIQVRDESKMPPLFSRLDERKPPLLDYVGVSYGLTKQLHRFWKKALFAPVYLRQTANDLTGEHTVSLNAWNYAS